ncbi:MAG: type IV secretion system protein [Neisseria animaloris]|nr:type IV secretion system protein [Neisseria animaloris]
MTNIPEEEKQRKRIEAHLAAIRSEYEAKTALENKQKKMLLGITGISLLFAAASIGLNYYLFPLKQTQPIIAVVDGKTGIVTEVSYPDQDTDPKKLEPLVKSYAYSYVIGRYGYNYLGGSQGLRERYRKVSIFSGDGVKSAFEQEISPSNPNSPYSLLEDKGEIDVKVIAVTLLPENRVQVDFQTALRTGKTERINAYSAVGEYATNDFDGLSVSERWLNPFGFKFVKWSASQKASNDALPMPRGGNVGFSNSELKPAEPAVMPDMAVPTEE